MAEPIMNEQSSPEGDAPQQEVRRPKLGRRHMSSRIIITEKDKQAQALQEELDEAMAHAAYEREEAEFQAGQLASAAHIRGLHEKYQREKMLSQMTIEERLQYQDERLRTRQLFEDEPLPEGTPEDVAIEKERRAAIQFVHDANDAGHTVLEHAAVEAGMTLPLPLPEGMHDYGKTAKEEREAQNKMSNQNLPNTPNMPFDALEDGEKDDTAIPGIKDGMQPRMAPNMSSQQDVRNGSQQRAQASKVDIGNADFNTQAAEDIRLEQEQALESLKAEFEAEESRLNDIIKNGSPEEQALAQAELEARQLQYSLATEKLLSLFSQRSAHREAMLNERAVKMAQPGPQGGGKRSIIDSLRNKKDFQDKYLKFSKAMPGEKERVVQEFRASSNAAALRYRNLMSDSNRLQAATEKVRSLTEQSTKEFLNTKVGAELDRDLQKLTTRSMSVQDSRDPEKFAAKHEDIMAQFAGYKPVDPKIAAEMKGLKANHAYKMENSSDPAILAIKGRSSEIQQAADEALDAQKNLKNNLQKIKDSGDTSLDVAPLKKKIEDKIIPNVNEKPFDPADTKGELAKKNMKLAADIQKMMAEFIDTLLRLFGIRTAPKASMDGASMDGNSMDGSAPVSNGAAQAFEPVEAVSSSPEMAM